MVRIDRLSTRRQWKVLCQSRRNRQWPVPCQTDKSRGRVLESPLVRKLLPEKARIGVPRIQVKRGNLTSGKYRVQPHSLLPICDGRGGDFPLPCVYQRTAADRAELHESVS